MYGGAMRPADYPLGGAKRRGDVCALRFRQSRDANKSGDFSYGRAQTVCRSITQNRPGRHDDAALDDIGVVAEARSYRPGLIADQFHVDHRVLECFSAGVSSGISCVRAAMATKIRTSFMPQQTDRIAYKI